MFFFFYEDAYFYLCFMTEFEIVSRFRNGEERGEERRKLYIYMYLNIRKLLYDFNVVGPPCTRAYTSATKHYQ